MSIEGRINIDCLFHDKDGTNAINVLTLQSATEYTTGKVAVISRTVSSGTITLDWANYLDAQGQPVSIGNPTRLSFKHSGLCTVTQTDDNGNRELRFVSLLGEPIVVPVNPSYSIQVQTVGGSATLTAIVYGDS
jgi:hypothetical protein